MKKKVKFGSKQFQDECDIIIRLNNEKKSREEIAKELGCCKDIISLRLKLLGIKKTTISCPGNKRLDITEDIVKNLYLNEKMSAPDIARKFNCDVIVIYNRLKSGKVEIRSASEGHKLKPSRYWLGKKIPKEIIERKIETCRARTLLDPTRNKKPEDFGRNMSGKNNPFYGKKHTEEVKRIIREKRAYQVTPVFDTSIEIKIQNLLKQLGIEYFTHHFISDIEHKYNCDIFIPSTKTIIECDGDYFHANPEFYKEKELREKQLKQKEFDRLRNKELQEKGYNVIRIWENKIYKMNLEDLSILLKKIPQQGAGA